MNKFEKVRYGRVGKESRPGNKAYQGAAHSLQHKVDAKNYYVYGEYEETEEGESVHYFPTLEEVAERFNIHHPTVSLWSSKERWSLERSIFKKKIQDRLATDYEEEILSESASFDKANLDKLGRIHSLLDKQLDIMEQVLEDRSEFAEEENEVIKVDLRALESITRMLVETHKVVRNVTSSQKELENTIGESTVKQRDKLLGQKAHPRIKGASTSQLPALDSAEYREEMLQKVMQVIDKKDRKAEIDNGEVIAITAEQIGCDPERAARLKRIKELKSML